MSFTAYRFRMYPTIEQQHQLFNTVGCSRYAYNWAVDKWKTVYEAYKDGTSDVKPSAYAICRMWTAEKPSWASETAYCSQQAAIHNVGKAYTNHFRDPATFGFPKFKKKGIKDSFYVDNAKAAIHGNRVRLPNIGKVKLAETPELPKGKITSYTIRHYAGQWHLVVSLETEVDTRPKCVNPESAVGIDVGLKHAATCSDGTVFDLPTETLSKLDRKLRKAQRKLSKKKSKSSNYRKTLRKKQRIQLRMNNIRNDACHKFTTAITKSHGIVVIEDIDIQGLKQDAQQATRAVRHAYQDSVMSQVLWQLQYKAQTIIKAPRFYPSSKTCSICGHVKNELPPSIITYRCEHCGATIDRDINASINLVNYYYTHVKNNNKSNS